jgi:hypothetical protein
LFTYPALRVSAPSHDARRGDEGFLRSCAWVFQDCPRAEETSMYIGLSSLVLLVVFVMSLRLNEPL